MDFEGQQLEMFTAVFTDIATRDLRESMEFPCLSLSKNPRLEPIRYETSKVSITVTGGKPYGIANIWDWDLMMWLFSQIRQSLDEGGSPSRKVRFHRRAFLQDARGAAGGAQYQRLEQTICRLKNTTIRTSIRAHPRKTVMFNWLDYAEVEADFRGDLAHAVVVLPEWVFDAVANSQTVLSIHPDYRSLSGGLERWLYRLIRKGAGRSNRGWEWSLQDLHVRSATLQAPKYFRREIRRIASRGTLLDYQLSLKEGRSDTLLRAVRMGATKSPSRPSRQPTSASFVRVSTTTLAQARRVARTLDVGALHQQWVAACERSDVPVRNPDRAFLAYCRQAAKSAGLLAG